jgi:hypothetical protein
MCIFFPQHIFETPSQYCILYYRDTKHNTTNYLKAVSTSSNGTNMFSLTNDNVTYYVLNTTDEPYIDLAFGTKYCHSLLLTASASTFAFWMSYLSRSITQTFYNVEYSKAGGLVRELTTDDFFMPHWIPIYLNRTSETVSIVIKSTK